MATLTAQADIRGTNKTQRATGTDKAVSWLSQVMAAVAGTNSGEDALSVLNRKVDEARLIDHGTTNIPATETSAWIHVRTDNNSFFIKERTGAGTVQDPYSYFYQGPFFAGSYRVVLLFSTDTTPQNVSVSWNWENATFNITAGGSNWSRDANEAQDKWLRIVELPGDSNTAKVSQPIRIGDPVAEDISYDPPSGDGNISSSVDNVKEALDAFHDYTPPAAPTTPTTGDSDVQVGELTSGWTYSRPLTLLFEDNSYGYHSFTVNSNLRNLVTTYGTALSIAASASFTSEAGTFGTIVIRFGVADNSNNFIFSDTVTIESNNARTTRSVKVFGNLPDDFTGGRFLADVTSNTGNPVNVQAGFNSVKFRIEPDEDADSVPVDRSQFGDNIPSDDPDLKTAQDALEVIDDLPLELADTYDLEFPGPPNGIDDTGQWVLRRLPLARLIPIRNARPQQAFTGKIQYSSAYISGSRQPPALPPPDTVTFTHRVWSNVPDDYDPATHGTQLDALTYLANNAGIVQEQAAVQRNVEVSIPHDCTEITVGFKSDSGQNDARLHITGYNFDIEKGINSSGFDGNLTDNVRSLQSLGQAVDDLTTTEGTAAETSVDNTQFDDPQTDPGGLRDQSLTITNAQEAFNVIDDLNQAFEDPFKVNQVLDFGGTFTNAGTINSGTALRTNDIDIDSDLRALSADVAVRVKIRVNAITNDFRGNVSLIDGDNPGTRYGELHPVNGSGVNSVQANDFIILQRVIPAAQVPTTVQVQWDRISSTGSATFDRGKAYMVIFPAAQTGGMGQSVTITEAFMWIAGGLSNSRQTGTGPYTLLSGHTWPMYHILEFGFDNGTNSGMYKPMVVFSSTFQASGAYGTMDFTDFIGYNVKPVGTGNNEFEFVWGNRGIRHVKGFRIVIN